MPSKLPRNDGRAGGYNAVHIGKQEGRLKK